MKERGLLETAFVTKRKYFWVGDFSTGDVGNFQPALTEATPQKQAEAFWKAAHSTSRAC